MKRLGMLLVISLLAFGSVGCKTTKIVVMVPPKRACPSPSDEVVLADIIQDLYPEPSEEREVALETAVRYVAAGAYCRTAKKHLE